MKPRRQFSPLCLVIVIVLFLLLTAPLGAAPVPVDSPVSPNPASSPLLAINANRTNVVRIAALGMALALFIMYRTKH
jgi:hypothetical protein